MKVLPLQLYILFISTICVYAVPNPASQSASPLNLAFDSVLSAITPPPDFDFWKSLEELGEKGVKYADDELAKISQIYCGAAGKIEEFTEAMRNLVDSAADMHMRANSSLEKRNGIDFQEFSSKLSAAIDTVIQQLMAEFSEPPTEDQAEQYQKFEATVSWALEKIEDAIVTLYGQWGISEVEAREQFGLVKPHIRHVVLVARNLVDKHPYVLDLILFSVVMMILPEESVVLALLQVFGFGPLGPVKGYPASWLQRFFFRTGISKGSWFSQLQRGGMRWSSPGLGKKIIIGAGFGAGIIGGLGRC